MEVGGLKYHVFIVDNDIDRKTQLDREFKDMYPNVIIDDSMYTVLGVESFTSTQYAKYAPVAISVHRKKVQ